MMTQKELVKDMEAKIITVNHRIDDLQTSTEKLPQKVNHELTEMLGKVSHKRDVLKGKLDTIKKTSNKSIDDLEIGVKFAWEDLSEAYKSATERFKQVMS
jgi:predicted  nucleic acid-binding Zn-ribbon protein